MKKLTIIALLALFASNTAFALTEPMDVELNDIEGHIYQTPIEDLYWSNVIKGDEGKQTFRPDDGINRAEITKIIVLATSPGEAFSLYDQNCFPDVKKGEWYTKYVCYAKEQGWVKGFNDGLFRPGQNVTNFEGMKIAAKAQDIQFTEGTPWYANLVNILAEDNLIPFTVSTPHADLTRGEMADLMIRIKNFQISPASLEDYLRVQGRDGINVTLETIEEELDLSNLERQEVCASGSC